MSLTGSSAIDIARAAASSSRKLATVPDEGRRAALQSLHDALSNNKSAILEANRKDIARAQKAAAEGELSHSLLKRLDLSGPGKYDDMLQGVIDVRDLEDPSKSAWQRCFVLINALTLEIVGKITMRTLLDDGLCLERVTCPIGVLLIIFEARPEVIVNIAALAIKSGNAAILKGKSTFVDKGFMILASLMT